MAEKELITPIGKHKVLIKDFLTGGEKLSIISEEGVAGQLKLAIDALVVSVNGNKENTTEQVLNMHGKDFDGVVEKVSEVMGDSILTAEKKTK